GMNRSHHRALLRQAPRVTAQTAAGLARLTGETAQVLDIDGYQLFVVPADSLNAYTFGLVTPQVVVLYRPMIEVMDEDELRFVIGHEMGHVRLGHTWLNSLIGGMAGIPSPFAASAILAVAFLWWNRACEYSADRAGLLACGNPRKAISALLKIEAGGTPRSPAEFDRIMRRIDAEDDTIAGSLGEALSTHPMTINRIEQLQKYAASGDFRRQLEWMKERAAR
ncbi:MAG: M48 family metallopeptidase, partial [Anaerolineae bacterium]|nr:M48 family metallopeptidase [Anaerolineae bacterium]